MRAPTKSFRFEHQQEVVRERRNDNSRQEKYHNSAIESKFVYIDVFSNPKVASECNTRPRNKVTRRTARNHDVSTRMYEVCTNLLKQETKKSIVIIGITRMSIFKSNFF